MHFYLKYILTLFYKKLRIKIVVCLLRESGPWILSAPRRGDVLKPSKCQSICSKNTERFTNCVKIICTSYFIMCIKKLLGLRRA